MCAGVTKYVNLEGAALLVCGFKQSRHAKEISNYLNFFSSGWKIWLLPKRWW